MKTKLTSLFLACVLLFSIPFTAFSSQQEAVYQKHSNSFFGTFDTWVMIIGFTTSNEDFTNAFEKAQERFTQLHQLYDKFNAYEGVNNVYTLNHLAAQQPVMVEKDLLDMLLFAKQMQETYPNTLNIAMGSVLDIWHEYRDTALADPSKATLPSIALLEEANAHTDIHKVIINEQDSTVFFEDPNIQLDVGAVAKGYATQLVAKEMPSYGMSSFIISAGGNVVAGDPPKDGRDNWVTGIQDPNGFVLDANATIDSVKVSHLSVVTSGDYQRYYEFEGKKYHHIIDPATLFPADYVKQVTVVTPDSGMADFLSTVLFVLPTQEALAIVESLDQTEACWVTYDNQIITSSGWAALSTGTK